MIRENFDNDIKSLSSDVLRMMDMTSNILVEAIRCLQEQDLDGARNVFRLDDEIDSLMAVSYTHLTLPTNREV